MNPYLVARLAEQRLLPVIGDFPTGFGERLGHLLVDGGLGVVELTLRVPHALQRLSELATSHPGLLVGAGTVLRADQVDAAAAAGAAFVVSPGTSVAVIERCRRLGLPVFPGVGGATDVMTALEAGVDTLKLFPAAQLGGPAAVAALAAPFPDVRFIPSGGIGQNTAVDYLAQPSVLAVSGSWATPSGAVTGADSRSLAVSIERAVGAVRPAQQVTS